MNNPKTVLITGLCGEIGTALSNYYLGNSSNSDTTVVAIDRNPITSKHPRLISYQADILDHQKIEEIITTHKPDLVFHLAALLSSESARRPLDSHRINVDGALHLIESLLRVAQGSKKTQLVFPSSVAVYGVTPDERHHVVRELDFVRPSSIYGIQKLYVEQIGTYFSSQPDSQLDFRSIRFPGLLSAESLPTGGTTDFASEMIHAAAQGKNYSCFLSPDLTLPFLTMPDAVRSMMILREANEADLQQRVYNVTGFRLSPRMVEEILKSKFPQFKVEYNINPQREAIASSWPQDMDASRAVADLKWAPTHDLEKAFTDYLIPNVCRYYQSNNSSDAIEHCAC